MAAVLGGAAGGPVLWMAIRAKDETKQAFDSVGDKVGNLGAKVVTAASKVGTLMMSFATLGRVTGLLSDEQARLIGILGTIIRVFTTAYAVAKTIATAVTWAHNVALTWEVSLLTLGIGVAIAAAAALAVLAMQTRSAAEAQKDYNVQLERGNDAQRERERSRQRSLIRRGEMSEVI